MEEECKRARLKYQMKTEDWLLHQNQFHSPLVCHDVVWIVPLFITKISNRVVHTIHYILLFLLLLLLSI